MYPRSYNIQMFFSRVRKKRLYARYDDIYELFGQVEEGKKNK